MNRIRWNALAAFLLMAIALTVAHAWKPTQHLADTRPSVDLEKLFPRSFGTWVTDDRVPVQLISPDIQATLNKLYNQTLSRTYVNASGQRIMLSVAYGGDQSDATRAHRPEVCYPAQGFQLLSNVDGQLDLKDHSLRVRKLIAQLGGRVEPITYWIVVGDKVALSGTEQKVAQLRYSMRGVIPDGMLVRVSSIDSNGPKAFALHAEFVAAMMQAIPQPSLGQVMGFSGA